MPHVALARADALEQLGEGEYAEPLLSVLMGERVDEGLPDEVDDARAFEPSTILGAG